MLKKRLLAFSIAEALVTMLIVALIIMLTMPVVSKKNVKGSGTKGSWECVRDPETGVYKSISYYPEDTANPNAEKVPYGKVAEDGKSCIFTPPKSARNFTVNVIGGGGGGASSSVARDSDAFSTVGTDTYIPEYTGYYDILLIGGGGAGGCVECGHGPAGNGALGGAAGGVLLKKGYLLTKGKSYTLVVGAGGNGHETGYGGNANPGLPGGDTKFIHPEGQKLVATGGKGGFGGTHKLGSGTMCQPTPTGDGWKQYGLSGTPRLNNMQNSLKDANDPRNINSTYPGFVCNAYGRCVTDDVSKMLDSVSGSDKIGRGGYGGPANDTNGYPGYAGIIVIKYSGLYAGGGGHAGTHVYKIYKKLPSEVVVKVGLGGAGGVNESSDGSPGEASAFGNLAVAGGGSGGKLKEIIGPSQPKGFLAGGNGQASPLGGVLTGGLGEGNSSLNGANDMDIQNGYNKIDETFYGAGGGGGGSKDKKTCATTQPNLVYSGFKNFLFPMTYAANVKNNQHIVEMNGGGGSGGIDTSKKFVKPESDYSACWGYGGRGAMGLVRVEWN